MTFGDLVTFESRRWSNRSRSKRLLQVVIMVLIVAVSVILALLGYFKQPNMIWLVLLGILYVAPGIGAAVMVREWKEDTWYWWLSLPAHREKLLAAKLVSALGRWIRIWLVLFVFVSAYIAIIDLTLGQLSWSMFLDQIRFGWQEGILAIVEGPMLIAMGLWLGALRDKNRLLLAPLWAIIIMLINIQFPGLRVSGAGADLRFNLLWHNQWLAVIFVSAYSIAAIAFFGLAHWLKYQK